MTDLRERIARKLHSLTTEQLNIVLFDLNAIASGVEIANADYIQAIQRLETLKAKAKNLQDRNSILDYQNRQLEEENSRLKQENQQLKHRFYEANAVEGTSTSASVELNRQALFTRSGEWRVVSGEYKESPTATKKNNSSTLPSIPTSPHSPLTTHHSPLTNS